MLGERTIVVGRWWLVLALLALGAPFSPVGGPARPAAAASAGFGYGFNVVDWSTGAGSTIALVREAGFGWVKGYVSWARLEPSKGSYAWQGGAPNDFDNMLNAAASYGMKLLVRVDEPPAWASAGTGRPYAVSPADLQRFLQALAAHGGSRVAAYEIFNEPNLNSEWGASPNPAGYVALLRAASAGVKAGFAGARVVAAGLASNACCGSMNDLDYLRQMYAAGARGTFDALGSHPYGGSFEPERDPNTCGICFRRAELQRQIMVENGDGDKQLWATEFGYLLTSGYDLGGFNWMKVSEAQQADYLVRAFDYAFRNWGWAGPFFVFNHDYSTAQWCGGPCYPPTTSLYWFSVLNEDRSPRQAYTALKNMPKDRAYPADPIVLVQIDTPTSGATVSGTVAVAGWALDRNAASGTGVDQVHLYLDAPAGQPGSIGLGVASYGGSRPDVGAAFGSQFTHSGWSCAWNTSGLSPGSPTLSGYARSTASGA